MRHLLLLLLAGLTLPAGCGPRCEFHCIDSVLIAVTLPAGVQASEISLSEDGFICQLAGNGVDLSCWKDEQQTGSYSVTVSAPGHPDRVVDYTLVDDETACSCGVVPVSHQVSWT